MYNWYSRIHACISLLTEKSQKCIFVLHQLPVHVGGQRNKKIFHIRYHITPFPPPPPPDEHSFQPIFCSVIHIFETYYLNNLNIYLFIDNFFFSFLQCSSPMPNTFKLLYFNMECSTPIGILRHFRFVCNKTYFVVVHSVISSETTKKVQTDETCLTHSWLPLLHF